MTVTIRLPWEAPPLNQNDRRQHMAKARAVKAVIDACRYAIRAQKPQPITEPVVFTIHYRMPNRIRRDCDNLAHLGKACLDAVVLEGVLPADDFRYVTRTAQELHPPSHGDGELWLTLEEVWR